MLECEVFWGERDWKKRKWGCAILTRDSTLPHLQGQRLGFDRPLTNRLAVSVPSSYSNITYERRMFLLVACVLNLFAPCTPYLSSGTAQIIKSQSMHCSKCTPLHAAARSNNLESVRYLVELGADKEKKDGWGYTPAEVAGKMGPFPRVTTFLTGSTLRIGSLVVHASKSFSHAAKQRSQESGLKVE